MHILWTAKAAQQLKLLPQKTQKRVAEKMRHVATLTQAFPVLTKLKDTSAYKIRVGDYRVIGTLDSGTFMVVIVGHRSKVYKELE
ncbi:MAG: type II toxin-antitoxin system RelE/ParE family toxin [Patescibacteria group bacterium]